MLLAALLGVLPGCERETSKVVVVLHPSGVLGAAQIEVTLRLNGRPAQGVQTFPGDRTELDLQLPDDAHGVLQVDLRALDCHGCVLGKGADPVSVAGPGRYEADVPLLALQAPACSAGKLQPPRANHAAVLLPTGPDQGQVLVVGGLDDRMGPLSSTEIYDPRTQTGAAAGPLSWLRVNLTVNQLADGRLLVAGGENAGSVLTADLYDPQSRTFHLAASLKVFRAEHAGVTLLDGRVLVVGGHNGDGPISSAEVYDPEADQWSPAGQMREARGFPTATLLPSGKVLVAGGEDFGQAGLASAEIFDPAAPSGQEWSDAGQMNQGRYGHRAVLLTGGDVLVVGGYLLRNGMPLGSAELYHPAQQGQPGPGTWGPPIKMTVARAQATLTVLRDGRVLVAGGEAGKPLADLELYDPSAGVLRPAGRLSSPRDYHTATLLPDGGVLMLGGWGDGPDVADAPLLEDTELVYPAGTDGTAGCAIK